MYHNASMHPEVVTATLGCLLLLLRVWTNLAVTHLRFQCPSTVHTKVVCVCPCRVYKLKLFSILFQGTKTSLSANSSLKILQRKRPAVDTSRYEGRKNDNF